MWIKWGIDRLILFKRALPSNNDNALQLCKCYDLIVNVGKVKSFIF